MPDKWRPFGALLLCPVTICECWTLEIDLVGLVWFYGISTIVGHFKVKSCFYIHFKYMSFKLIFKIHTVK